MNATIQKNISERLLPVFLNVWISAADCLDCVVHVVPTSEAQEIPILMQLRFQVGAWSSVHHAGQEGGTETAALLRSRSC